MAAPLETRRRASQSSDYHGVGSLEGSGSRAQATNERMLAEVNSRLQELSQRPLGELSDAQRIEFQNLRRQRQKLLEDQERIIN